MSHLAHDVEALDIRIVLAAHHDLLAASATKQSRRYELEDVAQETALALLQRHSDRPFVDRFGDVRTSVSRLTARTARYAAMSLARRARKGGLLGELSDTGSTAPSPIERPPVAAVREAVRILPEVQRAIVVRRYFGGETLTEIAESFQRSVSWASGHHRAALRRLREVLAR